MRVVREALPEPLLDRQEPVRRDGTHRPGIEGVVTDDDGAPVLLIKTAMHPRWHIYARVPPGSPYVETAFEFDLPDGVSLAGKLATPPGRMSLEAHGLFYWEKEAVFSQPIAIDDPRLRTGPVAFELR